MKKEALYIIFDKNGVKGMRKTRPEDEHFVKINFSVDENYFQKHQLEASLHITPEPYQEFELEIKRLKSIK